MPRGSCLSKSKPELSGTPAPGHPRAGGPSSAQPRMGAGVCPAAPLPQPRSSRSQGRIWEPCPPLRGAGRTLTPPALVRGSSWHEGAGQGTWLRGDGCFSTWSEEPQAFSNPRTQETPKRQLKKKEEWKKSKKTLRGGRVSFSLVSCLYLVSLAHSIAGA